MTFLTRLLELIFSDKREKAISAILPLTALFLAGMILVPQSITALKTINGKNIICSEESPLLSAEKSSGLSAPPEVTPDQPASSSCEPIIPSAHPEQVFFPPVSSEIQNVHLTTTVIGQDMFIFVRDSSSSIVTGKEFRLNVQYPSGQICSAVSKDTGSVHLSSLPAGVYTVSMTDADDVNCADSVKASVSGELSYAPIQNISELVKMHDVTEVSDEVKTATHLASQEMIAADITVFDFSSSDIIQAVNMQEMPQDPVKSKTDTPFPDELTVFDFQSSIETLPETASSDYQLTEPEIFTFDFDTISPQFPAASNISPEISEQEMPSADLPSDAAPVTAVEIAQEPNSSSNAGWRVINGKTYYLNGKGQCITGFVSIGNKLHYFDVTGAKAKELGIDVSFYNGTIDWMKVKDSGIDFVILRCGGRGWSTGALYDDSCFQNYLAGARSAGLKVGVYFYSTATSLFEAVEEASVAIWRLNGIPLDYPIYIDMEYSGDYPEGRADKLSSVERVQIAQAFCRTVQNAGYQAGVYSSQSFFTEGLNFSAVSNYNIWIASYTENNALPKFSGRYDVWQLTDRGRVPGISGYVDIDVVRDQ